MGGTSSTLDSLALLVRVILAVCPEVVPVIVVLVSVSKHRFLKTFTMCIA